MRQEMMGFWDGSGISWTICKQPAPRSRQITTRTPHHSFFYRPDALPDAQLTLSEHRRHSIVEPSKWRTLIRILCSNHKDRYLLNKCFCWYWLAMLCWIEGCLMCCCCNALITVFVCFTDINWSRHFLSIHTWLCSVLIWVSSKPVYICS